MVANIKTPDVSDSDRRFWTAVAIFIVLVAVVALAVHYRGNGVSPESMQTSVVSTSTAEDASATSSQTYSYSCDGDKAITATFHLPEDDFANVNLSDGRHLILAHAISADGARYANADQAIVFWDKGVTAFVTENGTTTYSGCVANRFP